MKWAIPLSIILFATALTACNGSSSSSSSNVGGSSGSAVTEESFTNDSQAVLASYEIAGPRAPNCIPDETFTQPLPTAWIVSKPDSSPTRLVVFAHGIGHSVGGALNPQTGEFRTGSWLVHMRRELRLSEDVAFVSTDYRDNFGFPALWGAHDTIAATLQALERFPDVTTVYLFGVSMGGAVSGTAITEANVAGITKPDGSPLFDYWLDVEGVSQLHETWTEALGAFQATGNETAKTAVEGIQRDTGGTYPECVAEYQRRSPAQNAAFMGGPVTGNAFPGIRAATVIHAVNDGLVPYNQGREMASELASVGIPTQFFTVLTSFSCPDDEGNDICAGTTLSGNTPVDENNSSGTTLAGHASESVAFHPVMATAFINLRKMLAGTYNETIPYFECVVDTVYDTQFETQGLPASCQVDQFQPPQ